MADQSEAPEDQHSLDARRSEQRMSVLKSAKILFSDTVVDCLVINMSEVGARVRTGAILPIPERARLRFSDGATFSAVRRWTRGTEIGFSFEGTASLPAEAAQIALRIYELIRSNTLQEPLAMLQVAGFFGDLALQKAAEQADAALRVLQTELAKWAHESSR